VQGGWGGLCPGSSGSEANPGTADPEETPPGIMMQLVTVTVQGAAAHPGRMWVVIHHCMYIVDVIPVL